MSATRFPVRERLERALARIAERNPGCNALVYLAIDAARARADALDQALADGARPGALCGWIVSVKESFPVAGWPCTWGVADWADRCSTQTAPAVEALIKAGAIIIGKSNVPERLRDWQTFNPVYGTTRNPWCPDRTPGGSSGGAAAALAAGLVDGELGTDVASSIRTPAHFCGVVGHKPSFGLVPLDGHAPSGPPTWTDLAVAGPLARHARDADRLLRVVAQASVRDAPAWRVRLPPPRHGVDQLSAYRVAWLPELAGLPPAAAYRAAMEQFVDWLREQGVAVETLSPSRFVDTAALEDAYLRILRAGEADALDALGYAMLQRQLAELDPADQRYAARVRRVAVQSHRDWRKARRWQLMLREQLRTLFERVDVLLMPVAMTAAFPIAEALPRRERTLMIDGREWDYSAPLVYAALASLGQVPATAMPIGLQDADGMALPVGMQVLSDYLQDRTALGFAAAVESALPGGFPALYADLSSAS